MLIYRQKNAAHDEDAARRIAAALGIEMLTARLLVARGVTGPEHAQAFLHPGAQALGDPLRLTDMDRAAQRVREALERGEPIAIYGDYDADGVTASSVLCGYLRSVGADPTVYLPDRHTEGYGLNAEAVRKLAAEHRLMITVDCGITSVEEVALATSLGMDVIITDHHTCPAELPACAAVVDPHRDGEALLCGAGVALKLVQALGGIEAALQFVDLAAIGTVADLVPLLGENRAIVALGLARINRDPRRGIEALIKVSGLGGKRITAGHIAFGLGPRINAGGRIGHSRRSVTLLLTDDAAEATAIAADLGAQNDERQAQERDILAQAIEGIEADMDFAHRRVIIAPGEGWNAGVIGIVASRIVERYHYPTIVLTREGDKYVGSGRSIPGVHLYNALHELRDLFTRFGGHEMAAGLTMPAENLDAFARRLSDAIERAADPMCFLPVSEYDAELSPGEATVALIRELELLQPTGVGNPAPVFRLSDLGVSSARTMGKEGAHLRMDVQAGSARREAVAFRMGDRLRELDDRRFDMLATLEINEWNGRCEARLLTRSIKPMDTTRNARMRIERHRMEILRGFFHRIVYNNRMGMRGEPCAQADLEARIARAPQGVLMVALTPDAAQQALGWLEEQGVLSRVEISLHAPTSDRRAFHELLVGPDDGFTPQHDAVVVLDGTWATALVPEADATGLSPGWGEDMAALAAHVPDRAALNAAYRAIGRIENAVFEGFGTWLAAIARGMSATPERALMAVMALEELGLASRDGAHMTVVRGAGKRDPWESKLLYAFGVRPPAGPADVRMGEAQA